MNAIPSKGSITRHDHLNSIQLFAHGKPSAVHFSSAAKRSFRVVFLTGFVVLASDDQDFVNPHPNRCGTRPRAGARSGMGLPYSSKGLLQNRSAGNARANYVGAIRSLSGRLIITELFTGCRLQPSCCLL